MLTEIPKPRDGESCEAFTVRAHKSLLERCPDPDERNELVRSTWREHYGELPGESIASQAFSPEKYIRSNDHCVFVEHETIGRDGKPHKYTLDELKKIVRQHNSEINDIQAFPAIAEHHTPDKGDPNGKEPATLGFAGPFRLGMVGREKPRWAIFADEHHRRDAATQLANKPSRSVELWTFKDGRMRFHPIAAVGAHAPRLLMPAKYTIVEFEGTEVEKYTVGTAAFAGGGNTYLKSDKYALGGGGGMLAPDDIAAIMSALSQTPEFVYLRRKMQEEDGDPTQLDDGSGQMGAGALAGELGPDDASGLGNDFGDEEFDEDDMDGDGDEPDQRNPKTDPLDQDLGGDETEEKFTMSHSQVVSVEKFTQLQNDHSAVVEKYTALQQSHDALIEKYKAQHDRIAVIERAGTDASRREQIAELVGKYSMALDRDELEADCLYSKGSQMSDEEFASHVAVIEKFGQKFAESPMVPRGVSPERYTIGISDAEVAKYEQRLVEEATKYHGEQQAIGKHVTWTECEAEAKKRIEGKSAA
jgi:hypothetical protein